MAIGRGEIEVTVNVKRPRLFSLRLRLALVLINLAEKVGHTKLKWWVEQDERRR